MLPIQTSGILPPERNKYLPDKSLHDLPCSEDIYSSGNNDLETFENALSLIERPSPVGGESIDDINDEAVEPNKISNNIESEEDWSDWENTNRQLTFEPSPTDDDSTDQLIIEQFNPNTNLKTTISDKKENHVSRTLLLQKAAIQAKKNIVDISELDIKNQKADSTKKQADEFDFFADMTPVIEKTSIAEVNTVDEKQDVSSKLNFIPDEGADESEGWGENWNE